MSEEKVSIRQFARDLGVSDTAIHKAVKAGRIVDGIVRDESGKPWIIPSIAKAEWGRTYNPNYERKSDLYQKLDEAHSEGASGQSGEAPQVGTGRSTAELKRLLSEIRVQKEAIELRKAKGELVDKKKVYAQLFQMGQEVRSTFQAIPDRIIDGILAARDRNEAHYILTSAISDALNQLSDIQKREIASA